VDAALHPFVGLALAVAADQFDLQVVQRVDVGEAVANGPGQSGVAFQAVFLAGDLGQGIRRALPFGLDGGEDAALRSPPSIRGAALLFPLRCRNINLLSLR